MGIGYGRCGLRLYFVLGGLSGGLICLKGDYKNFFVCFGFRVEGIPLLNPRFPVFQIDGLFESRFYLLLFMEVEAGDVVALLRGF